MKRQKIKRISAMTPIVLSLLAFGLVMVAVRTGWERGYQDEGALAHVFQLLIVAQVPFILSFIATANWKHGRHAAGLLALQTGALVLAFGPVAWFKL